MYSIFSIYWNKFRYKFETNRILQTLQFVFAKYLYPKTILQRRNPFSIPIIINNFNHYKNLLLLIKSLEDRGYLNIVILDNNSNYKPLLDFYSKEKYNVIKLKENTGHLALWQRKLPENFFNGYYVLTDPDVIPIESCPNNILEKFLSLLDKYPDVNKVGFGLITDDIPNYYPLKKNVIDWEYQFKANPIETDVYKADIDTTFALYRPFRKVFLSFHSALRTGKSYQARHMGWYIDPNNLSDEEKHLRNTVNTSSSWICAEKNNNSLYIPRDRIDD